MTLLFFFCVFGSINLNNADDRPNIVFIMADDLGWNDVSWHNRHMPTPVLESLAINGVILNQSYVNQLCSPTRSAFFTGHYPYHIGIQHGVFEGSKPEGVPLKFTFLSELLQRLGYKTHMIGKWHLGYCNVSLIPTGRGFDSFYGYYMGAEDYFTHIYEFPDPSKSWIKGLDFWNNLKPVFNETSIYSTDIFANRSVDIIKSHTPGSPFFLYFAFQAVHYPLQVPTRYLGPCSHIQNRARRIYCGMVYALDIAVGKVIKALKDAGQYDNTIIVFSTDNGGQTRDGGNNFPLRGNKDTLWEGGNRAISFVHAPRFVQNGIRTHKFSIVDWFPTLLSAIGKRITRYGDGINQWDMIRTGTSPKRNSFVYNIQKSGAALRYGRYKLITGKPGEPSGWIPEPNHSRSNMNRVHVSEHGPWLFDLKRDPTEHHNLARKMPRRVRMMKKAIAVLRKTTAPSAHRPYDPRGDPRRHNNTMATGWC